MWNGSNWSAVGTGTNGIVFALAVSGSRNQKFLSSQKILITLIWAGFWIVSFLLVKCRE